MLGALTNIRITLVLLGALTNIRITLVSLGALTNIRITLVSLGALTNVRITLVSLGALANIGSHPYKFHDEVRGNKLLKVSGAALNKISLSIFKNNKMH